MATAILSAILAPVAVLTHLITHTTVHPTFYPFAWITTLHAARVSLAHRARLHAMGHPEGKFGRGPEIAGFLLMCWGGGIASSYLVAVPPPQILSASPTVNYVSAHLIVGLLLNTFGAPSAAFLDTVLPLVDAILRTGAISASVHLVTGHSNPNVANSMFLQLIMGAIASAGGGVVASTFSVWDHQWKLSTPPFLRGGFLDTLDIWSGSVAAAVYGCLAGLHPGYEPFARLLGTLAGASDKVAPAGERTVLMDPLHARSVAVLVLTALYGYRAYATHYVPKAVVIEEKPVKVKSIKEKDL